MDAQRTTAELHGKLAAVRTQSLEEHLDFKVRSLQGEIRSRAPRIRPWMLTQPFGSEIIRYIYICTVIYIYYLY